MSGSSVAELARVIHSGSVALFLGGTDTGKTTLIRALQQWVGGDIVDGDVGQAWIGPPAVVSLGTPAGMRDGYFVGDVSPRGSLLQVVTGIAVMVRRAARPCLIDTDGYIGDGAALAYKTELLNLIHPHLLVLLQRRDELDVFTAFSRKGIAVMTRTVEHQGGKSREERMRAREQAFRDAFRSAAHRRWPMEGLRFERGLVGHGEPVDGQALSVILGRTVKAAWRTGHEATLVVEGLPHTLGTVKHALNVAAVCVYNWNDLEGLLVGCLQGGAFVGLGVLADLTSEELTLWTPVKHADLIQLGSLRLFEDGRHEPVRLAYM